MIELDPVDLRLRVRDLRQGLVALRGEALHRGDSGIIVPLALLEGLLGDEPGLHQLLAALEIGFGEGERALARGDLRFRSGQRVVRLLHVGLRGAQLRLVFRRGDLRDDLTLGDVGALLNRDFGNRPGYFEETSTWVASRRPFDLTMPAGSVSPRSRAIRFLMGPCACAGGTKEMPPCRPNSRQNVAAATPNRRAVAATCR